MFKKENVGNIVLENSLQYFFYEELEKLNNKNTNPLSKEAIYYSSLVLDKYGSSREYFENDNGKIREKVLGIKLLESKNLSKSQKLKEIKDIAETSLILCGCFSDSVSKKLNDVSYYQDIGRSAYLSLNKLIPSFYEQENFYKFVAESFHLITEFLMLLSKQFFSQSNEELIFIESSNRIKVA